MVPDDQSILNALGSNRKHVRMSTLKAICSSQINQLPKNEVSLVELFLAQIIQRCQDDEELMQSMLEALKFVLNTSVRGQDEVLFESIEAMINLSVQKQIYSDKVIEAAVGVVLTLEVSNPQNLQRQAALCFFFNKPG